MLDDPAHSFVDPSELGAYHDTAPPAAFAELPKVVPEMLVATTVDIPQWASRVAKDQMLPLVGFVGRALLD